MLSVLFGTEKLDFAIYAERGPSVSGLDNPVSYMIASSAATVTYVESETLQPLSKAREGLVSRASSRNQAQRRRGTG